MIYEKSAVVHGLIEIVAWSIGYAGPDDLKSLRPRVAIGRGDPTWDAPGATVPIGTETLLTDEMCRTKPYLYHGLDTVKFDRGKLLNDATNVSILRFIGEFCGRDVFPDTIDGANVREIGLFVNAEDEKDTGQLALLVRHGKVWFDRDFCMRRELIIDLRR